MTVAVERPFSPRALAAEVVQVVMTRREALDEALSRALAEVTDAPARDRALAFHIAVGSIRHSHWLERQLLACMPRPLPARESYVWAVLRTALFQCRFLRVPAHAAVHEAVALIKNSPHARLAAFANAVLRAATALEPESVLAGEQDPAVRLAVRHSHPEWLVRRWLKRLGPERTEKRLEANNHPAPLVLRANRLRTDPAALAAALAQAGVEATPCAHLPEGLILTAHHPVEGLPGYAAGWFAVQDQAAQLVSLLLEPRAGERILDLCAAPGGKCAHLAALAPVSLVAVDKQGARMAVLQENLARLGVSGVECHVGDGGDAAWLAGLGTFDRILVDAPCSGTGVIRRHPDIKLRRTPRELADLATEQARLLRAAAARLRPGGVLVYAVCSLEPEEGEEQVARFLREHPGWAIQPVTVGGEAVTGAGFLVTEPGWEGMDGFFAATLRPPAEGGAA